MSRLFFAALFLFPLLLIGQTYERSYGIEFAPHHGSRRISAGQNVPFTEVERQDSLEAGRGGFSAGIVFESRADKIGFTTGLRYLQTGYEVEEQSTGSASGRTFTEAIKASYISVPFELNFHQDITEKDRVHFILGVAAHLHLQTTSTQTVFQDGNEIEKIVISDDPDKDYRSPVVSLNTGIGFDRKLSENWAIRLQPNFQFFLQGNLRDSFNQTNRNYYQLGVRLTVRRLFL